VHQARTGRDEVLGVVDHQQEGFVTDGPRDPLDVRCPRLVAHAERGEDRVRQALGALQGGKLHPGAAMPRCLDLAGGDLQREPCLAAAAGSGQRQEP